MKFLRILLFPFSVLYGFITFVRNFLFDVGILKSYTFNLPIIAVGNLSVGGTGKTPQIEYLIRLLSENYKIATLSRGYKRQSKGFILADEKASAITLGDEPFQFYQKFPNIQVAVDADRKNGIEQLLSQKHKPEIILLDDAFQHRKVKAGFYILLTAYGDLFCDDFMLPTGNLREGRSGAKRANLIVITKCPKSISESEIEIIKQKVMRFFVPQNDKTPSIFFSFIDYDEKIFSDSKTIAVSDILEKDKLLIAGIAKPKPFFDYLNPEKSQNQTLTFPDHHHFSNEDILNIKKQSVNKILITTEKDYVRLKDSFLADEIFYLPIKTSFINNSDAFDNLVVDFVKNNTPW